MFNEPSAYSIEGFLKKEGEDIGTIIEYIMTTSEVP